MVLARLRIGSFRRWHTEFAGARWNPASEGADELSFWSGRRVRPIKVKRPNPFADDHVQTNAWRRNEGKPQDMNIAIAGYGHVPASACVNASRNASSGWAPDNVSLPL